LLRTYLHLGFFKNSTFLEIAICCFDEWQSSV
jgi:hypothetical protein